MQVSGQWKICSTKLRLMINLDQATQLKVHMPHNTPPSCMNLLPASKITMIIKLIMHLRPLLITFMFLLLINSLEDEGGRMHTSLFHYSINNLALKNPHCMNTISFFSELVPWPKFSIIELELSGKLGNVYIRCSLL